MLQSITMDKSRFNVRNCFPVLSNIHRMCPEITHILCNIAHFLVLLFLVGFMLWYNQLSVADIKDAFYLFITK